MGSSTIGPAPSQSHPDVYFRIRWRSATPIRFARQRFRQFRHLDPSKDIPDDWIEKFYVIEVQELVFVTNPRPPVILSPAGDKQIRENTYLLKKNKQRISLARFVPASNEDGHFFLFSRADSAGLATVSSGDGEVRLFVLLPTGERIVQGFDLRKMVFRGNLDI